MFVRDGLDGKKMQGISEGAMASIWTIHKRDIGLVSQTHQVGALFEALNEHLLKAALHSFALHLAAVNKRPL